MVKISKLAFIDNISRGFPFGSLLLYKYDNAEQYSLIDGQQRFTTLREYQRNPQEYFPIEANASCHIESLMSLTGANQQPEDAQAKLKSQFVAAIKEMLRLHATTRNLSSSYLAKKIKEIYPASNSASDLDIVDIQGNLIKALDEYVNLSTHRFPAFSSQVTNPNFPRSRECEPGRQKTHEISVFAAQLESAIKSSSPRRNIPTKSLSDTISRYESLTDAREGLEIEDFSSEEMRRERVVTLPEFCRALGELVIEQCSACWPAKTIEQDDTVDTIGYNTLAIAFGIRPQEIAGKKGGQPGLPDIFANAGFENAPAAIERLIERTLSEYGEINGRFARYLRKPGSKEAYETSKSSGQLQFLSFFAALWFIRYGAIRSTDFEPKPGYKKMGYAETTRNLFRCFVLDMLTNQWKGSGDSRSAITSMAH